MSTVPKHRMTKNDREALRVYRSLLKQREAGTLPSVGGLAGETMRMPRVRLAQDVDLSKADPKCDSCGGSGVKEHHVLEDESGRVEVPVVCSCVVNAGGVHRDKLDDVLEATP